MKEKLLNQNGIVIWISGLSGAGKSTLAEATAKQLRQKGILTQILDGDAIRLGLNNNLGFSIEDRMENIRRAAEVAKLFKECGIVTFCCFVSPLNEMRKLARDIIGKDDFIEIFLSASLDCCEKRDVKGWYAKARQNEIKDFTGIDSPFEISVNPDLIIDTENQSVEKCAQDLIDIIDKKIS